MGLISRVSSRTYRCIMGNKASKPQRLNIWSGPAGRYDLYWSHRRGMLYGGALLATLVAAFYENPPDLVDYYKKNTEFERKQLEYQKIKLQEKYEHEASMSHSDYKEKKLREMFDDNDKPRPILTL